MGHFKICAQKVADSTRHRQIRQMLAMTDAQYKNYGDSLRWYDQRISAIIKGDSLNKAIKNPELANLMTKRREFVQKRISPGQGVKLHQYNIQNSPGSPRQKQQKEFEERLKKKGMKRVKPAM
jgi:hypothetical protein